MAECRYDGCGEDVFEDSDCCILHVELPEDEESEEFKRINKLKEIEVKERISKSRINLKEARLFELNIKNNLTISEINLMYADIRRNFLVFDCHIKENILLAGLKVGTDKKEHGQLSFREVKADTISLVNANIINDFFLSNVKIHDINFTDGMIGRNAQFRDVTIASFALFGKTKFGGLFTLDNCDMGNEISFIDSKFNLPKSQEEACRAAKNICESQGNREESDYYFYREMEARRKQKYIEIPLDSILDIKIKLKKLGIDIDKIKLKFQTCMDKIHLRVKQIELKSLFKRRRVYIGFLESPVQYLLGYGVFPYRVIGVWLMIVFIFGFLFWGFNAVNGIITPYDYFYFSIFTATGFDFVQYSLKHEFQFLASIEVVFGIFYLGCVFGYFCEEVYAVMGIRYGFRKIRKVK